MGVQTNIGKDMVTREEYYEKNLGKIENVFHEIIPLDPHIDVYSIAPNDKHNYRILVTSGMSDQQMNTPEGFPAKYGRTEIIFPVKENTFALNKERVSNLLRVYAGFPHEYNTFLSHGHTIESYEPDKSVFPEFDDNFKYVLFLYQIPFDEVINKDFLDNFKTSVGSVYFLNILPVSESEYKFKMEQGTDALIDKLDEGEFPFIFDHLRKLVVD